MADEIEIPLHANHPRALREITAVPLGVSKRYKGGGLEKVLLQGNENGVLAVATDSYVMVVRRLFAKAPRPFRVEVWGRELRDLIVRAERHLKERAKLVGVRPPVSLAIGIPGLSLHDLPALGEIEVRDNDPNATTRFSDSFPSWEQVVEKHLRGENTARTQVADAEVEAARSGPLRLRLRPEVLHVAAKALGADKSGLSDGGILLEARGYLEPVLLGHWKDPEETRSFALVMPMRQDRHDRY